VSSRSGAEDPGDEGTWLVIAVTVVFVSSQIYDASAPFDANAVPQPQPPEAGEAPVMPGYEFEVAPDVPAEPEQLEALVEDADQYERVYQEGEMICTCVPAPAPPPGSYVVHYYGPVSFERERFPYADFGEPYEQPEQVHYFGPVSFERERYPYGDFGYPFDPNAPTTAEVVEEEPKASPRVGIGAQEPEKEDDSALIAAIMEEPEEDKAQYTVTTSTLCSQLPRYIASMENSQSTQTFMQRRRKLN